MKHYSLYKTILLLSGFVLLGSALSGCKTMSKAECKSGQWAEFGRSDARLGRDPEYFDKRAKACGESGIRADARAYQSGYSLGQVEYCTAKRGVDDAVDGERMPKVCQSDNGRDYRQGFEAGITQLCTQRGGYMLLRSGHSYKGTCTGEPAAQVQVGIRVGEEYRELKSRLTDLEVKIGDKRRVIASDKSTPDQLTRAQRELSTALEEAESLRRMIRETDIRGLALPSLFYAQHPALPAR
jgi:hypothetical protein